MIKQVLLLLIVLSSSFAQAKWSTDTNQITNDTLSNSEMFGSGSKVYFNKLNQSFTYSSK